jgi:hypothetical protein
MHKLLLIGSERQYLLNRWVRIGIILGKFRKMRAALGAGGAQIRQ